MKLFLSGDAALEVKFITKNWKFPPRQSDRCCVESFLIKSDTATRIIEIWLQAPVAPNSISVKRARKNLKKKDAKKFELLIKEMAARDGKKFN